MGESKFWLKVVGSKLATGCQSFSHKYYQFRRTLNYEVRPRCEGMRLFTFRKQAIAFVLMESAITSQAGGRLQRYKISAID
jgi:hypothetical protein